MLPDQPADIDGKNAIQAIDTKKRGTDFKRGYTSIEQVNTSDYQNLHPGKSISRKNSANAAGGEQETFNPSIN